ncbi:unnamed protein product [Citrullus colocynthis]|uniref:Uncharacterized protein n=1 Tax=Citrullus colocynthis TaxID=252529 RepID=A0ABP0Y9Y0_9ROSI
MCSHSSKLPLLTGKQRSASSKLSGPSSMCFALAFLNHMRSVLMLLLDIRDLIHTSSMAVIVPQVHLIKSALLIFLYQIKSYQILDCECLIDEKVRYIIIRVFRCRMWPFILNTMILKCICM